MADDVLPIRIVETDKATNRAGHAVSVQPARYVDADTAENEAGNRVGTIPFEVVDDLVTINSAGHAVPVLPVRIVEGNVALNEVGAAVPVLALRGDGGTPTPTPAPSWSVQPSISGTPTVGETLTGSDGTISNGTVSARAWLRDGTPISGATGATYILVEADEGEEISYRVSASGAGGSAQATSSAVGPVAGGTPAPTPITLATPTYYDAFDYTDGTRLVAGDPNANAGQVATNPGNLGWTALTTLSANNARFNPIIFGGKITTRSSNNYGEFTEPDTYLLSPGNQSGDQYIQAGLQPVGSNHRAEVSIKAVDQRNRVRIMNNDRSQIGLTVYAGAGAGTALVNVGSLSTARKMGGIHGAVRPFSDADEMITAIAVDGKMYLRRGPGFPIGNAAGYSFTDPGGSAFGVPTYNSHHRNIDFIRVGPAPTLLTITETFNAWYPKVKASSGAAITTGSAAINFSGTYVGTAPARLQWALFDPETGATVKDWAWVPSGSATIGGNAWSVAGLSIPVGLNGRKAYAIGFRPVDASNNADHGSAVVSVKHFYVALNIALIGQSNSGGLTNTRGTGNYPDFPGSATYQKADPPNTTTGITFNECTSYYLSTTNGADKCCARMGDMLSTLLNIPVCFEVMAIPATSATNLGPTGINWSYIQTHHAIAGGAFEALFLWQGENEFISGGSSWLAQWVDTNLPAYLAMSGQPNGTTIPIFFGWTGRNPGSGTATLASTKAMREGQDAFVAYANSQLSNAIALPAFHAVGMKMSDGLHYSNNLTEGYDEGSRRLALSVMKYLGGSAHDGMGPIATTATRSGAVITIDFDLNGATSLTARNGEDQASSASASALTSWEVSANDFASNLTISSAELVGNQVVLTLSADPGGPVKVRNHYGFQPTVTSWAFGAYADGSYIGSKPIITPLVSN